MQLQFRLLQWCAQAHGLSQPADWLAWAAGEPAFPLPAVALVPALPDMPALLRRRIDRLGRLACHVALACQPVAPDTPLVFASRYGDATRSLALLGDLVTQQALSPAGFGLAVHNAVSALYSMAQNHTGNIVVVAAARATTAAALTEAAGLLADGAAEVLVVVYDAPLPGAYASFEDEQACEYAWAWRVASADRKPHAGAPLITLDLEDLPAGAGPATDTADWPAGLAVLRQVLRQIAAPDTPSPALRRHDRLNAQWAWDAHA